LFFRSPVLIDAGLGAAAPLSRWLTAGARRAMVQGRAQALDTGRPTASLIAAGLPYPAGSPDDPAAGFLATLSPDLAEAAQQLADYETASFDVELLRCRVSLAEGEVGRGRAAVAAARRLRSTDWRLDWYEALVALAAGQADLAEQAFGAIRAALPGELAPKLAAALSAELQGGADPDAARPGLETVWRTDHGHESAAFALARLWTRRGDRNAAIEVLEQIPPTSRHADAAQIAAVRVGCGRLAAGPDGPRSAGLPGYADLARAYERLAGLRLDGGAATGAERERLTIAVYEAQLAWMGQGNLLAEPDAIAPGAPGPRGLPRTERELRREIEKLVRGLADREPDRRSRTVLIDLSNAVRPRNAWSW
jgi:serine/threonine-protein kinase PknG